MAQNFPDLIRDFLNTGALDWNVVQEALKQVELTSDNWEQALVAAYLAADRNLEQARQLLATYVEPGGLVATRLAVLDSSHMQGLVETYAQSDDVH